MSLVKIWQLSGAKIGIGIRNNDITILAVYESDMIVGIISSDRYEKLSVEAEIRQDIKGFDLEVQKTVSWDFRLEGGVEIEGED